jgi:hypothetical protein
MIWRRNNPRRFAAPRLLALLLLTCLSWGELAEVNHHHNGVPRRIGQAQKVTADFYPAVASQGSERKSGGKLTQDDCLLCQLHRNLFATAISQGPREAQQVSHPLFTIGRGLWHPLELVTSERGRAPPIIL